jgi:ubiquinone/menaquinone biosynthesis C-methylase UbiE
MQSKTEMQSMKPNRHRHAPKQPTKDLRTDWGEVAAWYDQLVGESGSEYHREVIIPGVLRLLAALKGEAVLDVACGQGVLCRVLQARGLETTGVDAAAELIRAARARGPGEIRYLVGDVRKLDGLAASSFDAAANVLAIQNIHPLGPAFRETARLLKPLGRLVIVMMHPCFRGAGETSWGWDEAGRVQYRRVDRYLEPRKIPIKMHPGSNPDQITWTFHRPIEHYIKALRQGGMVVDALEEWTSHKVSDSGNRAAAENRARKEIPMFLAIRAIKIGLRAEAQEAELSEGMRP